MIQAFGLRNQRAKVVTAKRKYRLILGLFIVGLVISGVTAFPLAWETRLLTQAAGISPSATPETQAGLSFWLTTVDRGLHKTYAAYPWVA